MKRQICPDCNREYLVSLYVAKSKLNTKHWLPTAKYCPSCYYTKYIDSGQNVVFSTIKKDSDEEDFVVPQNVSPEYVKDLLVNFKKFKRKQKEEGEKLAVLRRMCSKDNELIGLLNKGSSSDNIIKLLEFRIERGKNKRYDVLIDSPISDSDLITAIKELSEKMILLGYSSGSDEHKLSTLKRSERDMNRVVSYIRTQRKKWHKPETDTTIDKAEST